MDSQSPLGLILVGQTELWDRLSLQAYAAIRQRIDLQCKLGHLDRAQVAGYIDAHLRYAGVDHPVFADPAIDAVLHYSGGAARLINKARTHRLLYAA